MTGDLTPAEYVELVSMAAHLAIEAPAIEAEAITTEASPDSEADQRG